MTHSSSESPIYKEPEKTKIAKPGDGLRRVALEAVALMSVLGKCRSRVTLVHTLLLVVAPALLISLSALEVQV